jgi:hypothetical protein
MEKLDLEPPSFFTRFACKLGNQNNLWLSFFAHLLAFSLSLRYTLDPEFPAAGKLVDRPIVAARHLDPEL